jgi:flavin-dependent dehydrogenase
MIEADVAVIGAGPAGAAAALHLAPSRRVVLIERRETAPDRIGESLPAAAQHLLRALGVWETFLAEGHAPSFANCSVWGGAGIVEQDSLRDPDGHGWHLDRLRFENGLRATAVARGARLLMPAQPRSVSRHDSRWEIALDAETVTARVLIDAGGRMSAAPSLFGARRAVLDKLVCGWIHGIAEANARNLTYIEAEPDGWWYTAPLPGGRRVLAFHTDADLPASADARSAHALLARAGGVSKLCEVLKSARFDAYGPSGFCAAHSAMLVPSAGDGWLAAGDSALAFDPLSSQGLFNALYTGLFSAKAADAMLDGDAVAADRHVAAIEQVRAAYRAHLAVYYGAERRWTGRVFWRRRMAAVPLESAAPMARVPL